MIQIQAYGHSLKVHPFEALMLEGAGPFEFKKESKFEEFTLDEVRYKKILSLSLMEYFHSRVKDHNELKKVLSTSPYVSILKEKISRLVPSDQVHAMIYGLKLSNNPLFLRLHYPMTFLSQNCAKSLIQQLKTPENVILVQEKKSILMEHMDHHLTEISHISRGIDYPLNLQSLNLFKKEPVSHFQVKIQDNEKEQTGIMLKDHFIPFREEEMEEFFSLKNRDLVLSIPHSALEVSKKDKSGFFKADLLKQEKFASRFTYLVDFFGEIMEFSEPKRSPTPFVFLRPVLKNCFLFHPESKERVFPGKIKEK